MFCPKCGAQNPDGSGFCGSCGQQFEQRPAPAPQPAAGAPVPSAAGGAAAGFLKNNKMVVGAVAGVVVLVLLIVLIRMFACSGGGPNLVDIVSKPSADVAKIVKGQKEVSIHGSKVFTNNEDGARAMSSISNDDIADLKKYDGSYVLVLSEGYDTLSLEDIEDGSKPDNVAYVQVIASNKLTAKEVADRVAKLAPYEKVYVYAENGGESLSGGAKGNGCVTDIDVTGKDGVWLLTLSTYSISDSSSGSSYASYFDDDYDDFDASNYSDSYKK